MSHRPGMRKRPAPSTTVAPAGTPTSALEPTTAIRLPRTSTVCAGSRRPPATSTTVTPRMARSAATGAVAATGVADGATLGAQPVASARAYSGTRRFIRAAPGASSSNDGTVHHCRTRRATSASLGGRTRVAWSWPPSTTASRGRRPLPQEPQGHVGERHEWIVDGHVVPVRDHPELCGRDVPVQVHRELHREEDVAVAVHDERRRGDPRQVGGADWRMVKVRDGLMERPCPRGSTRITRYCPASRATSGSQSLPHPPKPCSNRSGSPMPTSR